MTKATKETKEAKAPPSEIPRPEKAAWFITTSLVDVIGVLRPVVEDEGFQDLVNSIREHGLLVPIVVVQIRGSERFQLICGARRLAAHRILDRLEIKADVYAHLTVGEIEDIRFVENVQREDLNPVQEAKEISRRLERLTPEALARRLGKSQNYIFDRMDLLRLHEDILAIVASGRLPVAHARKIARVGDPKVQLEVARGVIGAKYSERNLAKAAEATDFLEPLAKVRERITYHMQPMGSAGWPRESPYAGKRACDGCPDNSTTAPGLFDGITCPGKSARGNCTNKPCYTTKRKAWELQKKRAEAKRERDKAKTPAGTCRECGKAGNARERARWPEKNLCPSCHQTIESKKAMKAAARAASGRGTRPAPFPATPRERLAVALFDYGKKLRKAVCRHVDKSKPPEDFLAISLQCSYALAGSVLERQSMGITVAQVVKLLAIDRPLEIPTGLAKKMFLQKFAAGFASYNRPTAHFNTPLRADFVNTIDVLEALAKRWAVALPPKFKRPVEADFQEAPKAAPPAKKAKKAIKAGKAQKARKK